MENSHQPAATSPRAAFFLFANHPFKWKLYLLKNLPAAFFSGVKVVRANEQICSVSVPYKRFTTNPFHSTYFACLSMAAELSTGLLAMSNTYGRTPSVSLLITEMDGRFQKKAQGITTFTCADGRLITDAVEKAISTGEAQQVSAHSIGKNSSGETVAEFRFAWSFKVR